MADFLAYRIIDGKKTFSEVPKLLQPKVKAILIELGFSNLAE